MPVRIFVGNLPYNATEAELRELFSAVGPLSYVSLPIDRETGQQRGFAFLEFNDRAQADEAIRRFNHQLFKGRPLAVNEARAREDRPPSSAPSRPPLSRPDPTARPDPASPPPSGGKPNRNFGPDAEPHRKRSKSKGVSKSERGPKGPMREMVRGQFFGGDEDEDEDDFDEAELSGDDFAGAEDDSESGDETNQPETETKPKD